MLASNVGSFTNPVAFDGAGWTAVAGIGVPEGTGLVLAFGTNTYVLSRIFVFVSPPDGASMAIACVSRAGGFVPSIDAGGNGAGALATQTLLP